jgi:hypothetical protein
MACFPACRTWFVAFFALLGVVNLSVADAPLPFYNGLARPNGKQIVRVGDQWLVVTPEPSGRRASLSLVPHGTTVSQVGDGKTTFFLSADDRGLFRSLGPAAVPPSLVADRGGRVHAAWDDGNDVWYARTAAGLPAASLLQRGTWTGVDGQSPKPILADAILGDVAVTAAGEVWIAAVKRVKDGLTTLCLGRFDGKWEFADLAKDVGFHPPVLHVAADRSVHVAWSDTRGRILYVHHRPGEEHELRVLCKGGYTPNGRNPSIVALGKQVLIAFETLYDQVEYALLDSGAWSSAQRLTSLDTRLATDVLHSPQLTLDRHGVAWLIFSDTTRRFTYFTRWLGSEWSDVYDCRGIYYRSPRFESDLLPADWLAVEKYPPAGAGDIGIALANSLAPEKTEFHPIAVPAPSLSGGKTTLFLDLLEGAGLQNLQLVLDEARRDPRNPLVKQGPSGSFDQDRVLNHGTVLFDGDKFRMWYGAAHRQKGVYWWKWMSTGYAQSSDGIAWEKPSIAVPGAGKDLDSNQLPLPWPCAVFKDPEDKNPAGRYKLVQFDRHQLQLMAALAGEYDMDSPTCPGGLYQSADGIHWTSELISISFPDGKPWELVVQSLFIDRSEPDPARRWKIYGYASLVARRRAGCFAYSADGKKWIAYPRNPILDATVSEVPMVPAGPESQIHDTEVFPYRGYYLALFHAQHDARFLDVELAASRDGEHFVHVKHGHKVLPLGPPGAWDQQQILQTPAIVAHDKLWLFYGGQSMPPELLAKGEKNSELLVGGAGLATLRLDGFTHLALREGQTAGSFTTVPFEITREEPLSLVVNAACDSDATIAVEVLDADSGEPISGFARGDCQPLASDGVRSVVAWKRGDRLPIAGRSKVAFRYWLQGQAAGPGPRLYGFGFVASGSR